MAYDEELADRIREMSAWLRVGSPDVRTKAQLSKWVNLGRT